jgi:hypothetical protein
LNIRVKVEVFVNVVSYKTQTALSLPFSAQRGQQGTKLGMFMVNFILFDQLALAQW